MQAESKWGRQAQRARAQHTAPFAPLLLAVLEPHIALGQGMQRGGAKRKRTDEWGSYLGRGR